LNPAKCVFRVPEISFLGYQISSQGSQPLPERVADLQSFPPQNRRPAPTFLGNAEFLPTLPKPCRFLSSLTL
jgi:hypothetical protein